MKFRKLAAAAMAAALTVTSIPISSLAAVEGGAKEPAVQESWYTVVPAAYAADTGGRVTGYFANGNPITIAGKGSQTFMYRNEDAADESKWVELTPTGSDASKAVTVIAGAPAQSGTASASGSILMKGGLVSALIGSNGEDQLEEVTITVEGGEIAGGICIVEPQHQVSNFADRNERRVEKGTINVNGGNINRFARGTFSYSQVDELKINVTGGHIGQDQNGMSLFAGANGSVGKYVLNMSGGTVDGDVSSGQRALADEYTFNFTGGEIKGGIFPGGAYADGDNAASTGNWTGWPIGNVDYSVAKKVAINISGDAKYTDVLASLQNIPADVDAFNTKYENTAPYKTLDSDYGFSNLETSTTIVLGVEPGEKPADCSKCVSLTKEKADGVTVITPALSISLDKTAAELQLGESTDLKATLAKVSGTVATPSNAVKWTSSDESLVKITEDEADSTKAKATVVGYKSGVGTVTLTASVEGENEVPPATCNIKITEPKLTVSISPSTIAYDDTAQVTAKLTNVKLPTASDAEITYTANAPAELTGDDLVISDGTGAFGKATVTAEAVYGGNPIASGSADVTIKQPEMTIISDRSVIEMKDEKVLDLDLDSNYNYDGYEWSVSDSAVAEIAGSEDTAMLTAKKAGTVTVTVKGISGDAEGATATKKITVKDSRKFAWKGEEKSSVTLTINDESKSDTQTLALINDYEGITWSVDSNGIIEAVPSEDGQSVTVKGVAAGSTTLTAEVPELGETGSLSIAIVVVDAKEDVKVETGEPEIAVKEDVIDNIAVPEVDTEGLTDEQKQQVEALAPAIAAQTKQTAQAAIDEVIANKAVKTDVPTGLDNIVKNAGLLEDGEQVTVYMNQEITDVTVEAKTVVKEDGTVEVQTFVTSMVFDIQPFIAAVDQNGKKVSGTETSIADAVNNSSGSVTFKIPVPSDIAFNYANVTHLGETARYKINSASEGKYIRIRVSHFSEFAVEFINYAPTYGGGGGARPAGTKEYTPAESGKWILNETGWWYRYNDGSYPVSKWVQLPWNNTNSWYRFDAQGYLTTGWFQDGGHTYYLHPYADGSRGYMYTGWHEIDGKWYYFHVMEGGPLGAMAVSTATPDGFTVGADGVWVK